MPRPRLRKTVRERGHQIHGDQGSPKHAATRNPPPAAMRNRPGNQEDYGQDAQQQPGAMRQRIEPFRVQATGDRNRRRLFRNPNDRPILERRHAARLRRNSRRAALPVVNLMELFPLFRVRQERKANGKGRTACEFAKSSRPRWGGSFAGVAVSLGWQFRWGGSFAGVAVSLGWQFRWGGSFAGVAVSLGWQFRWGGSFVGVAVSLGWQLYCHPLERPQT